MKKLFLFLAMLCVYSSLSSQTLGCIYAQRGISSTSQQILRINSITGDFDTLSTLNGFSGGTSALAIDSINKRCFFSGWDISSVAYIYTMSLVNGTILQQPISEGQYNLGDLQYNSTNNLLYTFTSITSSTAMLLRIDPSTGNFDTLGIYTGFGSGTSALTLDVANNRAFVIASDSLFNFKVYTFDIVTGALLNAQLLEGQYPIGDPQYKPTDQFLYANSGLSSAAQMFLQIDPMTGNCDTIGIVTGLGGGISAISLTDNNECVFFGYDSIFDHRIYTLNTVTGLLVTWPLAENNVALGDPTFIYKCVVISDVEENSLTSSSITASPNPFTDQIQLQNTTGEESYEILTMQGQLIWRGKNIEEQHFESLAAGLYLIRIQTSASEQRIKLMKQ